MTRWWGSAAVPTSGKCRIGGRRREGASAERAQAQRRTAGLATFSAALRRGTVTTVAAVVVVAETVAPALAGIALLGDRAKPGLGVVAVLAFVATVVGAWVLTRADPGRAPAAAKSDGAGPTSPRPESRESA
jgi:hypothetical protein